MNKKPLLIIIAVVLLVVLLGGYAVSSFLHTSQREAEGILKGFPAATASQWYCQNDGGQEIGNQISRWEEIYVSRQPTESTSAKVEEYLRGKGYEVARQYIDTSQDTYFRTPSYWQVDGKRKDRVVQARVSSRGLTANNCLSGSSKMDERIDPDNYNAVIVIDFTEAG
jgi:hypothetical protein